MCAGHTGSTACNVSIVGTGALNTVKAAKVVCVTTDAYWKKRNGGKVVVYAGKPLYNLYKAQPANWKGEPCPQIRTLSPARLLMYGVKRWHCTTSVTMMTCFLSITRLQASN